MSQLDKARDFVDLHISGKPLILYNIWDAGSANIIAKAGAQAIATGSLSVAAAQGFADGENIPLEFLLQIIRRIAVTVDLPLSVDFEGCFAVEPVDVGANVAHVINAGAIGINFEDQIVGGSGLYPENEQCLRLEAARGAAKQAGVPLFINARTDLFLKETDQDKHKDLIPEAKARAAAYQDAGASGFFVPGLVQPELIAEICDQVTMPVNVMMRGGAPDMKTLASLGVARISFGPGPYFKAMDELAQRYRAID
tara:strand:- start:114990 stop:115751 length:762 start_codon:yes stop_codon:yes gene_type:complete